MSDTGRPGPPQRTMVDRQILARDEETNTRSSRKPSLSQKCDGKEAESDNAPPSPCSARGRPREFDADEALAAAIRVFWCRGYEGASLTELTEAMGITRPSLYACFGNKEALFRKAFDRYAREKIAYVRAALAAPTARAVAKCLLEGALQMHQSDGPKGCLGMQASLACGAEGERVRADVIAHWSASDAALAERFERAKTEGDLPEHVDAAGLAHLLGAILRGMNLQARLDADSADLRCIVKTTLMIWPRD